MIVLAVDPGLSGAVVLLGNGVLNVRRDFKTRADITRAIQELGPRADIAVMEFVSAMPGQGVTSMFSFGKSAGAAESALVASGFDHGGRILEDRPGCYVVTNFKKPLLEVTPQRWQAFFWEIAGVPRTKGARKNFDSVKTALQFLPHAAPLLTRKKDHNTADALLIALWLQMNPDSESSRKA